MFDGWGDDFDLDLSDGEVDEPGWEDDDLFGSTTKTGFGHLEVGTKSILDKTNFDDEEFPPAEPVASTGNHFAPLPLDASQVSWEGDDDFFGEDDNDDIEVSNPNNYASNNIAVQPQGFKNQRISAMVDEISKYVKSLNRMLKLINAVLEFKYNTVQKAEELVEYYIDRPELAEYTRTKELPRMNYKIILPHGKVETETDAINNLLSDNSLVSRAANQSLLVDLFHVITGDDFIVQPQFFAICVATWCQFTIHIGDQNTDMIDCRSKLALSLPTEQGDRLQIAEVNVSVIFSPIIRMVEFKIQAIDVMLQNCSRLVEVAQFVDAMEDDTKDTYVNEVSASYRDEFVEKSQRFLSLGVKSALSQMDSVVNIKGKLQCISKFIPQTDLLIGGEEETQVFADEMKRNSHRSFSRPPPPPPGPVISSFLPGGDLLSDAKEEAKLYAENIKRSSDGSFPRAHPPPPPSLLSSSYRFPRPLPSNMQGQGVPHADSYEQQNILNKNRPQSILGGLVTIGWKTLAKSVVPDGNDPATYCEQNQRRPSTPPPRTLTLPLQTAKQDERPIEGPPKTNKVLKSDVMQKAPLKSLDLQSDDQHIVPDHEKVIPAFIATEDIINLCEKKNQHEVTVSFENELYELNQPMNNRADEKVTSNCHGWDDFADDFNSIDDTSANVMLTPEEHHSNNPSISNPFVFKSVLLIGQQARAIEINHDAEDDIVETRKRWVNRSQLLALKYYVKT